MLAAAIRGIDAINPFKQKSTSAPSSSRAISPGESTSVNSLPPDSKGLEARSVSGDNIPVPTYLKEGSEYEKMKSFISTLLQKQTETKEAKSLRPHVTSLSDTAKNRLINPKIKMSLDESILCIREYTALGSKEAKKAHGKELVFFLGNSRAGKSTTINYLYGCKMEIVSRKTMGMKGSGNLVRVNPKSKVAELTKIGHEGGKSETFMPTIISDGQLTFCDCPGFFDSRGMEVNLANLINIKSLLQAAKSAKVIILMDHQGIQSNNASAVKDLVAVIKKLINLKAPAEDKKEDSVSRLKRIFNFIWIGVHRIEPEDATLENVKEELFSLEIMEDLMFLKEQTFIFDPTATESRKREGMLNRKELLDKIRAIPVTTDPTLFHMVLDDTLTAQLKEINERITANIEDSLKEDKFEEAAGHLRNLSHWKVLNHELIINAYENNCKKIKSVMKEKENKIKGVIDAGDLEKLKSELSAMKRMCSAFYPTLDLSPLLKNIPNLLKEKLIQSRLKNIMSDVITSWDEIIAKVIWPDPGKMVLTQLRSNEGFNALMQVEAIKPLAASLKEINDELLYIAKELEQKLKRPEISEEEQKLIGEGQKNILNNQKLWEEKCSLFQNRLEKMEAKENLPQFQSRLNELIGEMTKKIDEKQSDDKSGDIVLKALINGKDDLNQCLENLSSVKAIEESIKKLKELLIDIEKSCNLLEDSSRCDTYREALMEKFDRLKEQLERNEASKLVSEVKDCLKENKFIEAKNVLEKISQLDPTQKGGMEILKAHVEKLKSTFNSDLGKNNYSSVKDIFKQIKEMEKVFATILIQQRINLAIEPLEQNITDKLAHFKKEMEKEIDKAFSLETLKNEQKVNYTELRSTVEYWKMTRELNGQFAVEQKKACKDFGTIITDYANTSIITALETESVDMTVLCLIQLRNIMTLTGLSELVELAKSITKEFLEKNSILVNQVGSTLSKYKDNLEKMGRFAGAIIDENGQFKTISTKCFNLKTSTQNADFIFNELKLSDNKLITKEYKGFEDTYEENFKSILEKITSSSSREIVAQKIISQAKKQLDLVDDVFKNIGPLLGHIFGAWTYLEAERTTSQNHDKEGSTLKQPKPMQVISILLLLGIAAYQGVKNQLLQIKTGEGKSLIIAAIAIVLALKKYHVDVACYSDYLSGRDREKFANLFNLFSVNDFIHYKRFDSIMEERMREIGDTRKLTEQLLANEIKGNTRVESRDKRILFIDEVDVFFSERFLGRTLNPLLTINNKHFIELLREIYKKAQNNESYDKNAITTHPLMNEFLKEYPNAEKYLDITATNIMKSVDEVITGKHRKNHNYKIEPEGIGYIDEATGNTSLTTSYSYATKFSYIQHADKFSEQLVNSRVGFDLTAGNFSYTELPKNYPAILGVTGTLESLSAPEKEIISQYQINETYYMPSIYRKEKLNGDGSTPVQVYDGEIDAKDDKGYFKNLKDEILEIIRNDRAVLVVFSNIERLNKFENFLNQLAQHPFRDRQGVKCQRLTEETTHSERKVIITEAAARGCITYLTRIFGRGSDFLCEDSGLRNKGGVHVIQTFFSENESEEVQIKGRTCRQDDPGTYKMMLYLNDLNKFEITKQAQLSEFLEKEKKSSSSTQGPEQNESKQWYAFLQTKRLEYLKKNHEKIKASISNGHEKHKNSMEYTELLEKSGSLFSRGGEESTESTQKKEQAFKLLRGFQ